MTRRHLLILAPAQDKDGNTVIVLPANLPLDRMALEIANPYFHRTVNLYGSSTGKEDSYHLLTSQVIYRFPLSEEQHEERTIIEQHVAEAGILQDRYHEQEQPAA